MTYITYPQAEELLRSYPKLKSYLKILQIELEKFYHEGKNGDINLDDIFYSLAIGNRVITDMPHAATSPGDKALNIIIAKDRIAKEEFKNRMAEINVIGEVVEKTASALNCLTSQERQIINDKYFENMPWKEIVKSSKIYLEERRIKQIRQASIEKMLPLLRITPKQFEFCMEKIKEHPTD